MEGEKKKGQLSNLPQEGTTLWPEPHTETEVLGSQVTAVHKRLVMHFDTDAKYVLGLFLGGIEKLKAFDQEWKHFTIYSGITFVLSAVEGYQPYEYCYNDLGL